jgi:hypothetical protein
MRVAPSILASEETWGPVTRIALDPERFVDLCAELLQLERPDLIPLIEPGEPGRLIVTAGGIDWPFGGL